MVSALGVLGMPEGCRRPRKGCAVCKHTKDAPPGTCIGGPRRSQSPRADRFRVESDLVGVLVFVGLVTSSPEGVGAQTAGRWERRCNELRVSRQLYGRGRTE